MNEKSNVNYILVSILYSFVGFEERAKISPFYYLKILTKVVTIKTTIASVVTSKTILADDKVSFCLGIYKLLSFIMMIIDAIIMIIYNKISIVAAIK